MEPLMHEGHPSEDMHLSSNQDTFNSLIVYIFSYTDMYKTIQDDTLI